MNPTEHGVESESLDPERLSYDLEALLAAARKLWARTIDQLRINLSSPS